MNLLHVKSKKFNQADILETLEGITPQFVVSNIEDLTNEQCESLKCGDVVVKVDSAGKHAYTVSYKKDDEMSLTYCDHSNVEEIYYEKSGGTWTKIVKDITPIGTFQDVTEAQSGTIQDVLGLNSEGKLVKGTISSGTEVVANPTLAGTEASLEGIQIDDTKYKVGAPVVAYEGTSLLPTDVVFEDWTLHRAIKDNNMLWVTLAGNIKNNASSSQSFFRIMTITLPTEISSRIYREDGSTCNNAPVDSNKTAVIRYAGTYLANAVSFMLVSNSANIIELRGGSATLGVGESARFDVRIPLFLDIGTVGA